MLSQEYLAFREAFAKLPPPGELPPDAPVEGMMVLGLDRPIPEGMTIEKTVTGGVPAEWAKPQGAPEGKLLVYIHGGGFQRVPAGKYLNQPFVAVLAELSGMCCAAPDYRLMPEHHFPATIDDCAAFYRGLLEMGWRGRDIALIGESAGGNLALSLWLWCKMYGVEKPAGIAALSPAADLSGGEAHIGRRLAPGADLTAPLISPRYGDFRGLEQVFIQYGTEDLDKGLREAGLEMMADMRSQGVDVTFDSWEGLGHAFATDAGLYPEADEACRRAVDYLKKQLAL